jgi:hypothetical protein
MVFARFEVNVGMSRAGCACGIRVAARFGGGTDLSLHAKPERTLFDDVWWRLGVAVGEVDLLAWLRCGSVGVCGLCGAGFAV